MRTYLHGAALLLVGIVAVVTPAALAASSSLETTYRQLMEGPKVAHPPPPQVYAGKTQKVPLDGAYPRARAPLHLIRSVRPHTPWTQLQALTACQMVSIVILFDRSSMCLRRPRQSGSVQMSSRSGSPFD